MLAAMLLSCSRPEPPPPRKGPPPPEPELPPVASAATRGNVPEWVRQLPAATVTAKPGSWVWATVPQPGNELATVAVYRLEAISGEVATLVDKSDQRADDVPTAVIHAVGDTRNLKENTLALFYTWTTPGWLGRVSHSVRGEELRVQYDWAGSTKETTVDHAEAVRKGIVPLAYVGYPKAGSTSMGLLVALDASRAWVLTGSGHVEVHQRAVLESLDLQPKSFAVNNAVRGYRWATGFEKGTIKNVLEPGLRYEVDLGPNRPTASYFITALVAP
jgi:hypothetical protein